MWSVVSPGVIRYVVRSISWSIISGMARGTVAPPFLLSQEIQNNECIDIKTQ